MCALKLTVSTDINQSPATLPRQDSLGGNAKTSLILAATDAFEHVEESVQSLLFGLRAMRVTTQVRGGRWVMGVMRVK